MIIGSKELIRDMNSKLVLETIMREGIISRASIAKELGLTKATISAIVQDLMNAGLVMEIGSDDTTLGRKPILLSFHRKAGYAAAIDIGLNTISALVTDLQGDARILKRIRTPKAYDLIDVLIDLLKNMLLPSAETLYGLIGITIGIHGITSGSKVIYAPYYDLSSLNLAEKLTAYFMVPVILENEANLSVIGEKTYLPTDYGNIANISIHSGVGLGLILNHKLYTGSHGYAGEFGHTIIDIDGRTCPCGNMGCLEQYLSEQVLLKDYSKYSNNPNATLDELVKAYHQNNSAAIKVVDQFVKYMSVSINNLLNNLNPDIIIINSALTILFPKLIDQIQSSLRSRMNDNTPIYPSKLQDLSILLGGICTAVMNFLKIEQISFVYPNE